MITLTIIFVVLAVLFVVGCVGFYIAIVIDPPRPAGYEDWTNAGAFDE